jgi:hypothetical protein
MYNKDKDKDKEKDKTLPTKNDEKLILIPYHGISQTF